MYLYMYVYTYIHIHFIDRNGRCGCFYSVKAGNTWVPSIEKKETKKAIAEVESTI